MKYLSLPPVFFSSQQISSASAGTVLLAIVLLFFFKSAKFANQKSSCHLTDRKPDCVYISFIFPSCFSVTVDLLFVYQCVYHHLCGLLHRPCRMNADIYTHVQFGETDRETDSRTDGQTDRQSEGLGGG